MNIKTFFRKVSTIVYTLIFLFVLISTARSQTCRPPDPTSYRHFPQGNTIDLFSGQVFYSFENIPEGEEKNQIITAFNNWNNALKNTCAGITFVLEPPIFVWFNVKN